LSFLKKLVVTYALNVVQNISIDKVIIKYRYMGIPFVKEISVE